MNTLLDLYNVKISNSERGIIVSWNFWDPQIAKMRRGRRELTIVGELSTAQFRTFFDELLVELARLPVDPFIKDSSLK